MSEQLMFQKPIGTMKVPRFALSVLCQRDLRKSALYCVRNALHDFFWVQWRERLRPGRTPVSAVDHPLDSLVPFTPGYVGIYMDFIPFWIRTAAWLRAFYGKDKDEDTAGFIRGIADLYRFAAGIYWARLSTTQRPFYIGTPRFFLIHLTDPHFGCVPSLHVMIVVYAWLALRKRLRLSGDEAAAADRIKELHDGAMAITESILYVKQHSVNCISAALYVICILFPGLLPQAEAELFIGELFQKQAQPPAADAAIIRAHILQLYRRFMAEGQAAADWRQPLFDFLAGYDAQPVPELATDILLARVPCYGDKAME